MIREILLKVRGKSIKDGKWIVGDLASTIMIREKNGWINFYIQDNQKRKIQVDSDTCGTFIGAHTWDGQEIYSNHLLQIENDIFRIEWCNENCSYVMYEINDKYVKEFGELGGMVNDKGMFYNNVEIYGDNLKKG